MVLLLGGVVTTLGAMFVQRSVSERDLARFDQVVRSTEDRLVTRFEIHLAILRATGGVFEAGFEPSVEQFGRYVGRLRLSEFYPGVQGVGFSRRIRAQELDDVVARIRSESSPEFRVWPDTPRDEYHAIVLLEPRERRNRVAVGYDMFTEEVRRAAMTRARDLGRAAMSGKVTLVQETDPEKQPGFLIYVPVYAQVGLPRSVEERRELLTGFAYSPLRARDFFDGVFHGEHLAAAIEIYDGEEIDPEALLFDSGGARSGSFEVTRALRVVGRPWTIRYTSLTTFDALSNRNFPTIFAAVGAIVSLLLFFLVRLEVRTRRAYQSATALRERLLAIVGHDLRNPLGAITMGTAVLARKDGLDPSARAVVRRIETSAQRMARMIAELLDFARIQQGTGLPIDFVPTDVVEVVRQVVDEFQLGEPSTPVHLETEGPALAKADPDRLAEAVSNLVGNALQHGKGAVTVRVREREPELLAIEVHNPGPTIARESLPHLFDPYTRGRERVERKDRSLGLGLYIAQEIVRGHRGRIEVRSSDAEGTTFTVLLPRHHG